MANGTFYEGDPQPTDEKKSNNKSKTPVLDKFSTNITDAAKNGDIDPIVGRDKEVKRIAQILSRKKKNNAIIVGEPGVGKTALVEKLALLINSGDCYEKLKDKKIKQLDMASLVAGTKYRGQFEERIKAIVDELKADKSIILMIDEIHTMVGAGNSSGGQDAANILKPALARGEIQCIGATTFDEYKKHIEKDGALTRRFLKVTLNEPTPEETIEILSQLLEKYQDFHHVKYNEGVIETIVMLSQRYITDKLLPDKAIDVLDELGSQKEIEIEAPAIIDELRERIEEIKGEKIAHVRAQDFEAAGASRDEEKELRKQQEEAQVAWETEKTENPTEVTIDDVYTIVTEMTGVPISQMNDEETQKLIKLDQFIKKDVIGQDDAIAKIAKAVRRNRVGVKSKKQPIGSFMFIGTTGVGKTHLCKTIAKNLFGDENKMVRIDMSEYMDRHSTSKLIGSPPGFVGYEEGGQLTEKIKNQPFSVVLFDEVEKAHPDVFNMMLQILDEGRLTDSFGKNINFTNTLIILTSNVGAKEAQDFAQTMGFGMDNVSDADHKAEIIKSALKKKFKPEFLNRLDDTVLFNNLGDPELKQIIELELNRLSKHLKEEGYNIKFDVTIRDKVLSQNSDYENGARPIKRLIQKLCEDFITDEILLKNITKEGEFILIFEDNILKISEVTEFS